MNDLQFDRHQFDGPQHRQYPASAKTRISFDDYQRMQTAQHKGVSPWVPPFALNDRQLRQVLLVRAWRYVHGGMTLPENVDKDVLNKKATARALAGHKISEKAEARQHEIAKTHIAAVRRAGGLMQLWAAVAFRAWRLRQDSVAVAESLSITPYHVRITLCRLRAVAKELGFEIGRAGHRAGRKMKKVSSPKVRLV